jgi:hypothetical protein
MAFEAIMRATVANERNLVTLGELKVVAPSRETRSQEDDKVPSDSSFLGANTVGLCPGA